MDRPYDAASEQKCVLDELSVFNDGDISEVQTLMIARSGIVYTEQQVIDELTASVESDEKTVLLARSLEGTVVGMVDVVADSDIAKMSGLVVNERYRRSGIGEALVRFVLVKAEILGTSSVEAELSDLEFWSGSSTSRLLDRLGFEPTQIGTMSRSLDES